MGEWIWEFVQSLVKFPLYGDLSNKHGWLVLALVGIGSLVFLVLQIRVARKGPHWDWLAIVWGVGLLSIILSRRMAGGERYQLMGCVLLGLLLLAIAINAQQPVIWRRLAAVLLASGIIAQAAIWPARLADSHDVAWPRWADEVRAWRAGERDDVRIHPRWQGSNWVIRLPENLR